MACELPAPRRELRENPGGVKPLTVTIESFGRVEPRASHPRAAAAVEHATGERPQAAAVITRVGLRTGGTGAETNKPPVRADTTQPRGYFEGGPLLI